MSRPRPELQVTLPTWIFFLPPPAMLATCVRILYPSRRSGLAARFIGRAVATKVADTREGAGMSLMASAPAMEERLALSARLEADYRAPYS